MPRPERPLDPEDGPVARFALELRELRREAGSPGYRELARRAHYSPTTLAQAAGGGNLPSLAVTLAYVRACGGDETEWEDRWRAAMAEAVGQEPADTTSVGRGPYVGLGAYGPEDAEWFCGRDRVIAALTERVAAQRFVAVVGASGAGKSSVLRAGLVPALSTNGSRGTTLVITPRARPLEECAVRLGAELGVPVGQLAAEFGEHPRNLGLVIRQFMATRSGDGDFLLVVDQFEEVFTLCHDSQERERFLGALLDATHGPDSRVRVVVGLRADFYAHCARHPRLVAALQDAQVLVGPMNTDELTEAVTRPAVRAGLKVEKALVATVVHDAAERPGALPFVSHALWETWRRRRGNGMFLADYEFVGGVNGAIAQTADRVYRDLDIRQRRVARAILLRLTALGEGTEDTRRRVARAELGADPATAEVVDRLAAARLITMAEDTVEIAHEALIRGWPALREWLAADREALRAHRRLTEAAVEWDRHGRDEGYLYRGSVLAVWRDRELDTLNEVERAFLKESTAREDRDRAARRHRGRRLLVGMGVIVVVVSVLAVLAIVQAGQAGTERDLAFSRQLAANARSQLQVDPELALLLAIEAMAVEPTAEADAVLRQAIVDSRVLTTVRTGHGQDVAVSATGNRAATTADDGIVRAWARSMSDGSWYVAAELRGHDPNAGPPGLALSQDGHYAAGLGASGIRVWNINRSNDPVLVGGAVGTVHDLAFSRDGRLATASDDGVRLWDATGRSAPVLLGGHAADPTGLGGGAVGVAFSPDGRYLASSGKGDGEVHVWDLIGKGPPVVLHGQPGTQLRLAFSQDGKRLATTGNGGIVRLWDPRGGGEPVVLRGHQGTVLSMAFSPDGRLLASSGEDGSIQIISPDSDANPIVLRGHQGEVRDIAFSTNGRQLTSAGADGTLRVWSVTLPGDPVMLRGHDGPVRTAMFTPDGVRVVSGGEDSTVRVWSAGGGESVELRAHGEAVLDVDVSADGRRLASITGDESVLLWDMTAYVVIGEVYSGQGAYDSVELSPDGRYLVTGSYYGVVKSWDGSGGMGTMLGSPGQGPIREVALSPSGTLAAGAAAQDGTIWLWPTNDFRSWPLNDPDPRVTLRGHQGQVLSMAFAPDGRLLASGGHDGTVRIWPTSGEGEPTVLHGHQSVVKSVAFSPDGRLLATTARDGTLRIWHTTGNGESVVYHGFQASVETVAFSPDGRRLLTTHDDGTVRIQQCDICGGTEEVLELARNRTTRQLTTDERKTFGLTER